MLTSVLFALSAVLVGGQGPTAAPSRPPPAPLLLMDTTKIAPMGNYTLGYVNNTVENDCHIGVVKFQAASTGQVSQFSFGAFSQAANETCGIGFVLKSFPNRTQIGTAVSALFTDVAMPVVGTLEMIPFPVPAASAWNLEANGNYTITIQPFTWANGPAGGTTASAAHCSFAVPYGFAGAPQNGLLGYHGPTGLPCGSTPLTVDKAGDGYSLLMKLKGAPIPSATSTPTPSPTTTSTSTPTPTGTPTGSPTPTGTPTITDTPTPTLSPGATASNSATNTRTPSRTPSVSYSPTPTSAPTPSPTSSPTPTPTASLSFRATSSVTPTETPGPTDSHSPQPLAGVVTGPTIQAPVQDHSGAIVGAAIGGGAVALIALAVATRYRAVSIQFNKKTPWKHTPELEVNHNPVILATKLTDAFTPRKSKFETVRIV